MLANRYLIKFKIKELLFQKKNSKLNQCLIEILHINKYLQTI